MQFCKTNSQHIIYTFKKDVKRRPKPHLPLSFYPAFPCYQKVNSQNTFPLFSAHLCLFLLFYIFYLLYIECFWGAGGYNIWFVGFLMFVPLAALLKYWQFSPFLHSLSFSFAFQSLPKLLSNRIKQQFETDCNFLKCIGNYRLKDSAYDEILFIYSYLTSIEVDV